ncbi:MAG: murein hydrolase activator EnvC family protein [Bacteroides sp.]|jgi:Membrane-bound metallopeptidase
MRLFTPLLLLSLNVLAVFTCSAQTISDLQKQKEQTLARISTTSQLIEEGTKSQAQNTQKLDLINSQIETRNDLIKNINQQIQFYNAEINQRVKSITRYEQQLDTLLLQYANFIRTTQFLQSKHDVLLHILASRNLSQMYRRIRFYREYLQYQHSQHDAITALNNRLHAERDSLLTAQKYLVVLRNEEYNSRNQLISEQTQYNNELKRLMQKEKELRNTLLEDRKKVQALNVAINKLIEEEAEQNRKAKHDAIYKKLSKDFASNKGRLPWPILTGTIVRGYGQQESKLLKGIRTTSEGVDIAAKKNSVVRSIFNGKVTKVARIPGGNDVVIIRHGDFLTLYSNLTNLVINIGDEVKAGQAIGTLYTEKNAEQGILHFEIWKEFRSQNPKLWLHP